MAGQARLDSMLFPDLEKPIVHDIVYRHIEDAAFFWQQRNSFVHSPAAYFKSILEMDQKIDAHLKGICVAGQAGWRLAWNALKQFKSSGEMFVASTVALADVSWDKHLTELLDFMLEEPQIQQGFLSACVWCHQKNVMPLVQQLLQSQVEQHIEAGIAICALRRIDPGDYLSMALTKRGTAIQTRAIRAVGELGLKRYRSQLYEYLTHLKGEQQFWAAWSLVLIGDRSKALKLLCDIMQSTGHPCQNRALSLAIRALPLNEALNMIHIMSRNEALQRQAIMASGIAGIISHIPWLIKLMSHVSFSRIAGEAFSTMTGAVLTTNQLVAKAPDNTGNDVQAEEEDCDLPWPDAGKVSSWWQSQNARFEPSQSYLLGKMRDQQQLILLLEKGPQSLRYGAALELMLSGTHSVLFNTHSRGIDEYSLCQ